MVHVAEVLAADTERLARWSACDERCSPIPSPVNGPDIGKLHRPMSDVLDSPTLVVQHSFNSIAIPFHEKFVGESSAREAKAEATATREKLYTLHARSLSATVPYHKLGTINTASNQNAG